MEFSFTEEQGLLRESAKAFLAENSNSIKVREAMESSLIYNQEVWKKISEEMGWLALLIPEEYDGLGLTWVELIILLEQMGYFLLCSPFHSTVCLGVTSLIEAGNEKLAAAIIHMVQKVKNTSTRKDCPSKREISFP